MQAPWYPWFSHTLLRREPTVGWLMALCEENYRRLLRLAPGLREMRGSLQSSPAGAMDLHLEILEQTPYTSLIRLTYFFGHSEGIRPDPDATLRVYHDAAQAEVVHLEQRSLPLNRGPVLPTLAQKWDANLFLSKWLAYCQAEGHGFPSRESARSQAAAEPVETPSG